MNNNNSEKNNININNIYTNKNLITTENYNYLKKENEELKIQLKDLQNKLKSNNKYYKINTNNNNNNTSNSFILPSEFEKIWEEFSNILLEPFEYFISNNNNKNNIIFLANLIQDLTLIVYNETQNLINSKIIDIKNLLNIKSNSQNEEILLFFKPFFREHFKEIFILKENFIFTIINNLNNIINSQYKNIQFNKEEFIKSTKDKNLKNVIKILFNICLYMLLQNQIYSFNIKNYNERENLFYYYNHNNFICIDGFIEKNNSTCIVLVPAPLKRKIIQIDKIFPIVCLIEPDENIIKKCEENRKILEEKNERKKKVFNDDDYEDKNENEDKIIHISQSNVQNNKINVYLKKNNTFTGNFNLDDNFNINSQTPINNSKHLNENNNNNNNNKNKDNLFIFSFNNYGIKNRNKNPENMKLDIYQEGSITPTVRKVNNNQYMNFQTFTELSSNESRHNRNMTSNNFNDKSKNINFSFYANVAMKTSNNNNKINDYNKNYIKKENIIHTPNNKNNSIYNNNNNNKLLNSNFYNYSNNNNNVKYSYYKNNNQTTQINLIKKPNKNFNDNNNNNNNNFSFTYNQNSPKKNENNNRIYLSNEKKILNDLNININNYNNENTFRNQNKNNRDNNKYFNLNNNNNNNIININNSNFFINNINKYNKKNEENQSKNIINNIREQLNQMNNQLKQNFYFNNINNNNNNYNVNKKNYFNNNNNNNKQKINYTHQNNNNF